MDNPICPACRSANDENAAYCDQCGQPLKAAEAEGEPAEGGCPACGGAVESQGDGKGVCGACGLELVETPDEPALPRPEAGTVERLTAAILRRTGSGQPLESSVAEACREVFAAPAGAAAPGAAAAGAEAPEPCPLCGVEAPASAPRCTGCGLWFHAPRQAQPCPRCDRPVSSEGKCECGAILTLPKLLEYIEPSVKFVCSGCKQPYAVPQAKCPDCGAGLISAERIKAFAGSGS